MDAEYVEQRITRIRLFDQVIEFVEYNGISEDIILFVNSNNYMVLDLSNRLQDIDRWENEGGGINLTRSIIEQLEQEVTWPTLIRMDSSL